VPTDSPEADGTLAWESTTLVLVRVSAGGHVGTGWTYAPPATAAVVTGTLADLVTSRDPMHVPGLHEAMVRAIRNAGRPGIAGCALSAVDIALWDLKSRLLAVPLHRLLGAVHDAVPVYGSGGFTTYTAHQLEQQLSGWVRDQSIPRVKIKIGEGRGTRTDRDLDRIRHARNVIGGETELYVDANGAYSRKQAIRVAADSARWDVTWFEEPVSSDDLDGLHQIRQAVRPDVTAGEYGYDLAYFERMFAAGAVDCVQADVTRCGGITDWLRVAAVAAAHNLEVSGHCAPHAHAHAAAAIPNLRHLEWFHDHVRIEQRFFDGALDPSGGSLRPDPDAPGHGLTLREADIAPFQVGS
ncbi:MAG: enolase C-terminal domain-like protein, partial [Rhodococcus sp. (in: high G+C Gram-positive bacteria)]|uniref:enolase C-terminal domain-like protein n=1 Tax=Rhodococcus sp. TaxID=1831 RepID=UPI003BB118E9